jgi:hypothetical protein
MSPKLPKSELDAAVPLKVSTTRMVTTTMVSFELRVRLDLSTDYVREQSALLL